MWQQTIGEGGGERATAEEVITCCKRGDEVVVYDKWWRRLQQDGMVSMEMPRMGVTGQVAANMMRQGTTTASNDSRHQMAVGR